jgi:DNA-binding GntR family transcriptional regulator
MTVATDDEDPAYLNLSLTDAPADEPLVDSVYGILRDAICDGRLGSNRRLAQIPIAEHLGISRTPVRDALQRLAQEGLVRSVSFRGFVVSEFSTRQVLDVYEIRRLLEPLAVRSATAEYTGMDIAKLNHICDETQSTSTKDVARLYALNAEFHRALAAPSSNKLVVRLLEQLWQMPSSLRVFHTQATLGTTLKVSSKEHRGIVRAIEEGQSPESIAGLVQEHIAKAEQETIDALDEAL